MKINLKNLNRRGNLRANYSLVIWSLLAITLLLGFSECSSRKYSEIKYFYNSPAMDIYVRLSQDSGYIIKDSYEYIASMESLVEKLKGDSGKYYGKIFCITISDSTKKHIKEFGLYSMEINKTEDSSLVYHYKNATVLVNKIQLKKSDLEKVKKNVFNMIEKESKYFRSC